MDNSPGSDIEPKLQDPKVAPLVQEPITELDPSSLIFSFAGLET